MLLTQIIVAAVALLSLVEKLYVYACLQRLVRSDWLRDIFKGGYSQQRHLVNMMFTLNGVKAYFRIGIYEVDLGNVSRVDF